MISTMAPKHLSGEAKKIWRDLISAAKLSEESLVILKTALEAYDRLKQARETIDKDGITYKTESGYVRPHPALQIEKEACSRFLQSWRMLGIGMEAPIGRPTDDRELTWEEKVEKAEKNH